jgi:hypothetical protein
MSRTRSARRLVQVLVVLISLACGSMAAAGEPGALVAKTIRCKNGGKLIVQVPSTRQFLRNLILGESDPVRIVALRPGNPGRATSSRFLLQPKFLPLLLLACEGVLPGLSASRQLQNQAGGFEGIELDTVGREPVEVVEADLNADGIADLAIVNRLSNDVSVLLADADGTLGSAVSVPTGTGPFRIVAGDFNGDQVPDLLTQQLRDLSLLVNNGNGTFQAPVSRAAVSPSDVVQGVVVGDFNGDGRLDLVVSATGGGAFTTSLLLGNGDGSFQAPVVLGGVPAGDTVQAVADLDGDGRPDLITSTAVLLGADGGTFEPPGLLPPGFPFFRALVFDVSGDGLLDLVTLSVPARAVSVYLGLGNGTFQAPRHYSVTPSLAITLVDANGDGIVDILASDTSTDHFSLLLGNGDGTFRGAPMLATSAASNPPGAFDAAVADFNSDGIPDLAVAHRSAEAAVLFRLADGATAAPVSLGARGHVAAGDFDGDGQPDLAVSGTAGGPNTLTFRRSNGNGTFGVPVQSALPAGSVVSSVAARVNGDAVLDAVVLFQDKLAVLLGNGNGTFQPAVTTPGGTRYLAMAVADLNGDGIADVAAADAGQFGAQNGRVAIFLGNGDGTSQTGPSLLAGTSPLGVAVGDVNGDGRPDIVAVYEAVQFTWRIAVLRGNGDGTFQAPADVPAPNGIDFFPSSAVALARFDRDQHLDLILPIDNTQLAILPGNGDGTFRAPVVIDASGSASVVVADLNGDLLADLVVPNGEGGVTLVLNATSPDPTLTVRLNQDSFRRGQTLTATVTLTPGVTGGLVDAYVVVQVPPSGAFFSLTLGGGLVPGIVPLATGVNPFAITTPLITYRFTGAEAAGFYVLVAALAASGSAPPAVIGPLDEAPLGFIP